MAMVISHNIPALTTYNTVNRTNAALEKSIQKLSTGLRINSAADDAAGLAISEKMRSQINGMDRAVSNAQDGISMIQTAEGALNETHSILQRMRELSVQAANDTLTSQDRGYIQMEIDQLREEVTRIGNTTQFNKKKLLNGDAAVLWSSSDLSTKAIVNGGLRSIDQFGQKVVTEGNYNINIKSEPGQAEVQKSDIFKIKHENVATQVSLNNADGVMGVSIDTIPAGDYSVKGAAAAEALQVTGSYGVKKKYQTKAEDLPDTLGNLKALSSITDLKLSDGTSNNENVGKIIKIEDADGAQLVNYTLKANDTAEDILKEIQKQLKASSKDVSYSATLSIPSDDAETPTLNVVSMKNPVTLTITDPTGMLLPATVATEEKEVDLAAMFQKNGSSEFKGSASALFEVKDVDSINGTITLTGTATVMDLAGNTSVQTFDSVIAKQGEEVTFGNSFLDDYLKFTLQDGAVDAFSKGSKFVINAATADGDFNVKVAGSQNPEWDDNWGLNATNGAVTYALKDSAAGKDIALKNYYLNEKTGESWLGSITLNTDERFKKANISDGDTLSTFHATYVGEVAGGDVALRDLDKFWTSEGVFMLDDPQTITVTQGNGKQASVTLYATDTLKDVAIKLNDAIANGLDQGKYVNGDADHFATFVEEPGKNSESVEGTFLIRSIVPGADGTLSFAGNESIINAFSLNTIQNAAESRYTVNITDAHSGESVAQNVKISGNKLIGVVNPNVDVEFDSMSGISAEWDSSKNAYVYNKDTKGTDVTLHLSDNTTVFQIGANEGEDMGVHIGDMRATALGIDKVLVTDRESASRSITILDNAIDKVSTQRAKLGAYQNRLEHTINNLNTASENITAAESRIRDTDMAKEMMNFTKLQIMLQAGTSMLAQANQLPQNVMALVR